MINKKVSVVIPTYNSWDTLKGCIESIQNQTIKPTEIIIVDNASSDGTSNKIRAEFPRVKLITLEQNTGVTGGRNKGIEVADQKADYILFFDHDMIANKEMIEELLNISLMESNIGIVTPKIYYFDNKKRIWAAGTGINLWTGQIIFRGGLDKGQYEVPQEVQVAPAVLLVKKEVVNKIKWFDEKYFATYEDTDFCFRAKKEGFITFYSPKAIAFHKIPSNSKQEGKRLLSRAYWIGRNRILFMKDFGNFYIFLMFIPIYLLYYLKISLEDGKISSWFKLIMGTVAGLLTSFTGNKAIFAGERPSLSDIEGLHLAKYKFALKFCKGKNILEIGCGSGYGSRFLAENGAKKVTAYDIDSKAIAFAKSNAFHPNVTFIQGDAQNLKISQKYDVVLSFEVIEHLNFPEKLIQLTQKVIKRNGLVILSTPNKKFCIQDGNKPSNPYHVYEYYPQELKKILLKYFTKVQLYGVVLTNQNIAKLEKEMHNSLKWRTINQITNRRWVRKIINYLPESPKRIISGESKLSFKTDDFKVLLNREEEAADFVAVCK